MLEERIPQGEILKFVESYWEYAPNDSIWLAPQGTFHIVFSESPFTLYSNEVSELDGGFYLLPINSKPIQIKQSSRVIIVRLKAFALYNMQLNDQLIGAQHPDYWLIRSSSYVFDCFLKRNEYDWSQEDYLPYLNGIVYELLEDGASPNPVLRDEVNYILEKKGQVQVLDMANDFGISRQSLHKYFKRHLLVSPKELSAVWRVNHFLDLSKTNSSLTASAVDAGFFDQAHCINQFKKHFKSAPNKFLKDGHFATLSSISKRFNKRYDP